jgi:hypothetical protein
MTAKDFWIPVTAWTAAAGRVSRWPLWWRGRFRACNGVLALPPEGIVAFDAELKALLEARFPEPIVSRHRVFGIVGTRS